jgi:villin 1/advillin
LTQKLQQSKSGWTSILRLVENGEVVLWKEKFRDYPGELPISMQKQTIVSNVTGRKEQKPIDIAKMHAGITSDEIVVDDDGRGRLEVWKVEDFGQKVVPKEMFGQLFASSSFLLKYTYGEDGNEKIIIYFWQGRDSSIVRGRRRHSFALVPNSLTLYILHL